MLDKDTGQYRCPDTIDLEELIEMIEQSSVKKENVKAIIEYVSGRKETIHGKLKADGTFYQKFEEAINAFKSFPAVVNVEIVKY